MTCCSHNNGFAKPRTTGVCWMYSSCPRREAYADHRAREREFVFGVEIVAMAMWGGASGFHCNISRLRRFVDSDAKEVR